MKPQTKQLFHLRSWPMYSLLLLSFSLFAWKSYPDKLSDYIQDLRLKLKLYTQNSNNDDKFYLVCDKPLYEPGEVIWYSVFDLNANTLLPGRQHLKVELINPQGSVEATYTLNMGNQNPATGMGKGNFNLKPEQPGGLYKVRVSQYFQNNDSQTKNITFEREIQVQEVVMPRLKLNMEFVRKAYGPGSEVGAKIKAFTNANKPLIGKSFQYVVMLDGNAIQESTAKIDAAGEAIVNFKLPEKIEKPDGVLNLLFDYEGVTESVSRSIPIVLNKVGLEFFPEGGDLVNNLQSNVGFRALNEFKKPADVAGEIVDDKGKVVATFNSFHDGMGEFALKPQEGRSYHARLTSPAGISETYELPLAMENGIVLEVSEPQKDILNVNIKSTIATQAALIGQMRGEMQYDKVLHLKPGDNLLQIPTKDYPIGVLQLTLLDKKTIERAERLVFVNNHKQLQVKIKTDKEKYLPREKVKLTISTSDEDGMPTAANLALSVVDDQLLSFMDDKSSNILSWMLVESEIKGKVEEPKFYFDPKEENAPRALDLLLKTAGWRRFTWADVSKVHLDNYTCDNPAHNNRGKVTGRVIDKNTKEIIPFATVVLKMNGMQRSVALTDLDGRFSVFPLYSGAYSVEIMSIGYSKFILNNVMVSNEYTRNVEIEINPSTTLNEVEIVSYKAPIISRDETTTGSTITREEIRRMPTRSVNNMSANTAGAFAADDGRGLNVKGTRSGNTTYYVNGIKQMSPPATAQKPVVKRQIADDPKQRRNIQVENPVAVQPAKVYKKEEQPVREPHSYTRVREFAAPVYDKQEPVQERTDFRKTLFWQPQVSIGKNGITTLEFYTGDEITSYNILVEGISADGNPGRKEEKFYTQLPFSLAAKLPSASLENDRISVPLIMKNNTAKEVSGKLELKHPEGWKFTGNLEAAQVIKPNSTSTIYLDYLVQAKPGEYEFAAAFTAQGLQDAFSQPLRVEHRGYPVSKSVAGSEKEQEFLVDASGMTPGTAQVSFTAYPSLVTDMLKGVEGILREPYGCFEQTSSSSYPNLLALEYLREQPNPDAATIAKAEKLLEKGYNRLITFETKERGYEWFGHAPAHEGLTAYGLLQFTDMQRVGGKVDAAMMERTKNWMLSRRDGKGGFKFASHHGSSYGHSSPDIANAYITYSLTEAGYTDLDLELETARKKAEASNDPYQLALVTNALYSSGHKTKGDARLQQLLKQQKEDGSWTGNTHSVTHSTGQALKIETTSLALMAILKAENKPVAALQKGIKFLTSSRNGYGSFGSTQSTILALKALSAYTRYSKRTAESGTVQLFVNNNQAGERSYEADQQGEILLASLEQYVPSPGSYQFKVRYQKTKNPLPFSMVVDYYSNQPPNSPECNVQLQTELQTSETTVGRTVRYSAKLKNLQQEGLPMTMAVLGIPAGLSVQPWQLKELQEKKIIDFYEITGNRLACYFRDMAPAEEVIINLDLKAEFPGTYEAPASSAYLYYTNEHKNWAAGPRVTVKQ